MVKPIRFTTDEVLATLDGRKTTKRLLVKPRYVDGDAGFNIVTNSETGAFCYIEYYDYYERSTDRRMTPPCHTGDNLWVQETWCFYGGVYWHKAGLEVDENGDCKDGFWVNDISEPSGKKWVATKAPDKWRPSIHMPREAARIFLRVTDVRVERLQEITDEQATVEGIRFTDFGMYQPSWKVSLDGGKTFHPAKPIHHPGYHAKDVFKPEQCFPTARGAFANLWDSTIKPADRERYGWAANPFCWVISFERISKDEAMQ